VNFLGVQNKHLALAYLNTMLNSFLSVFSYDKFCALENVLTFLESLGKVLENFLSEKLWKPCCMPEIFSTLKFGRILRGVRIVTLTAVLVVVSMWLPRESFF